MNISKHDELYKRLSAAYVEQEDAFPEFSMYALVDDADEPLTREPSQTMTTSTAAGPTKAAEAIVEEWADEDDQDTFEKVSKLVESSMKTAPKSN